MPEDKTVIWYRWYGGKFNEYEREVIIHLPRFMVITSIDIEIQMRFTVLFSYYLNLNVCEINF